MHVLICRKIFLKICKKNRKTNLKSCKFEFRGFLTRSLALTNYLNFIKIVASLTARFPYWRSDFCDLRAFQADFWNVKVVFNRAANGSKRCWNSNYTFWILCAKFREELSRLQLRKISFFFSKISYFENGTSMVAMIDIKRVLILKNV